VSEFHPIWCLIAQELKLRRKFLGGLDIYPLFPDISSRDQTYPVQGRTCSPNSFQSDVCLLF
jgi:hypothetical protein